MVLLIALIVFVWAISGLFGGHEDTEYSSAIRQYDLMCKLEDSVEKQVTIPKINRKEERIIDRKIAKDENGREVWLEHTHEHIEEN